MATRVFMPKAGMAMEEGTVLTWFKKVGDRVEEGELLLEIETDKVNMELESPGTGVLLAILQKAGDVVEVTKTIGWIGEPGEEIPDEAEQPDLKAEADAAWGALPDEQGPDAMAPVAQPIPAGKPPATPAARRLAREKGLSLHNIVPSGKSGEIKLRDVQAAGELRTTPLARKVAADLGVNLRGLLGSGVGGKIIERDVLNANQVAAAGSTRPVLLPPRVPLHGIRKRIADRMLASHLAAPPVTLSLDADVTKLCRYKEDLNAAQEVQVSFNDLILKITALALVEFPYINACLDGDDLVYHRVVNLGMAVALDEGVIVPVIRGAEGLTLLEIARAAQDLTARARSGRLTPDQLGGGTFTVSNLGAYGIQSFTPILNPPEAGILGVCAIRDVVRPQKDGFAACKVMGLSLTFDHRVVDGAQGAIFLQKIVKFLENPVLLMSC